MISFKFLSTTGIALLFSVGGVLSDAAAASSTIISFTTSSSLPTTTASFGTNTTFVTPVLSAASATAGSNVTSRSTFIASASPSSYPTDTTDAWWFPLVGLSDDTSIPWGANVSTLSTSHIAGDVAPNWKAYEIIVNSTNPVPSTAAENNQNPLVIVNSDDTLNSGGSLVVTTNGDPILILGPNSFLNLTTPGSNTDLVVPTVPFGINYGHADIWNGSVTLGGLYDANRIASTSWTLVPESSSSNISSTNTSSSNTSSILLSGTQSLNVTLLFRSTRTPPLPAVLDLNSDTLLLPSTINCSDLVVESLTVSIHDSNQATSLLDIVIPANLTSSPERCVQRADDDAEKDVVVLGRPFVQAAYVYVDSLGQVYLAAAHQFDLPVAPRLFDAQANLAPAPMPTGAVAVASSGPVQNAAASSYGFSFGLGGRIVFAGLGSGVAWLAMDFLFLV